MNKENLINELVSIIKPYMSGLPCEQESGSCELTSCNECKARELTNKISNTLKDYIEKSDENRRFKETVS